MSTVSLLETMIAELQQAVGLATTAVPSMEMDANDPIGMMQKVVAEVDRLRQSEEAAWGLIANSYGGDWEMASEASGWKLAAERWRDEYHKHLVLSSEAVEAVIKD